MARKLEVQIVGDASSFQRALGQASKSGSGFGTQLKKVGKLAALGIGVAAAAAGAAGVKMIDLASDAEEVESKFKIVFGRTVPRLTKRIDAFARATGASRFELKEQVADLGALLSPIIRNTEATGDMSVKVAQLATDLGSFNNVPVEDALLAIRSGLVGEAEPLRRFGVLLNEAAVEAEGLRLGLIKQDETMTEGDKVRARYSLIMEQTALAQGDAVRTSGSFANQLKRAKNTVRDAGTTIGKWLLPVATGVVGAFNDAVPAIQRFLDTLGKAKGFKAKFRVTLTNVRSMVSDLIETIREELFGELIRKPLKLKSGKIIEWEEDRQTGLITSIARGLQNANWSSIGQTIGEAIGKSVRLGRDMLDAMAEWVDEHINEIADIGLKIGLTMINRLMEPSFWKENWSLVIGAALAVFPFGKVFGLGTKMSRALISGFGPAVGKALDNLIRWIGKKFEAVPGILRRAFKTTIIYVALERIRAAVSAAWDFIDKKTRGVLIPVFAAILLPLVKLRNFFALLRATAAFSWNFIKERAQPVIDAAQTVIDKVRGIIKALRDLWNKASSWLPDISGWFGGIGSVAGRVREGIGGFGAGMVGPGSLSAVSTLAGRAGLTMTSGYRPGDPGWHGQNRARDYAGAPSRMLAFAKMVADLFGGNLLELIHTPLGFGIKNGRRVSNSFFGPAVMADHYDHVHVAMDKGGIVPGRRGQPVPILAHAGETVLPTHKPGRGLGGVPSGPVMVLTTREIAMWLQNVNSDYSRAHGGRSMFAT